MTEVYKPHIAHQRRRTWARKRHSRKYDAWLGAKQTVLDATGTGQTYTITTAGATATQDLTFTGLPVADETFTVAGKTYTFKAAAAKPGEVTIGADADGCRDNVIAAINGTDAFNGAHPLVTASSGGAGVVTVDAIYDGEKANSLGTTEALTNAAFGGATLAGGASAGRMTTVTHGFTSGNGPFYVTAATTQPTGLADATPYWVEVIDANTFKLHASAEAVAAASPAGAYALDASHIQPSDTGTGTLTITPADSDNRAIHEWMNVLGADEATHAADVIEAETDIDNL